MSWERKIQEETAKKKRKMAVKERGADGEDYEEEEEEVEELEEKESSSSCTKQQQMGMETDGDGDDENEQDDQRIKSWEAFLQHRLLPKGGSLRVLLVEGDDSTRHIIAALLRKCNYRVSAVSDGLKAWEILKERPEGVDVVLAEVEVPSIITGFSLLSMIMDHPSCKHIPVIMMSCNGSINMVFKCMLKGAADFLVKPIRKNELRNLWQHVWRRHNVCSIPTPCRASSSSDGHGGINVQRDDNTKRELEASSQKENYQLTGAVPSVKECSEKGSDAQSSCTRSDIEAESTYEQITLEPQQQTSKGFSPLSDTVCQNGGERIQLNTSLLDLESKVEEFTPCNETSIENVQFIEEEHSCAGVNEQGRPTESTYEKNEMENGICHQGAPPKQIIIDLIGAIDNQQRQQGGYGQRINNVGINQNVYGTPEDVFLDGGDFSYKSASVPLLELSLRRYQDKEEKYGRTTLNHSNSSAFAPYGARTTVSPFLRSANLSAEGEEHDSPSRKQIQDKDFDSPSSNAPRWNGTARHLITEDAAKSLNDVSSIPNGSVAAIKCSPIRVIPMPTPVVEGINFDASAEHHVTRQPILYPESSGLRRWSNTPSKAQETVTMEYSDQSDTRDFYISHQHPHSQPPKGPILYSSQNEHPRVEGRDETRQQQQQQQQQVSSVAGDSCSSTKCHDNANHIHLGRICHKSNGNNISTTTMPVASAAAELRNQVEKKPTDLHRLNQREAALNKFRLKRKDRCFEKKVRYQSRKRLAEQRPRVKGQFVRHIQPDALTTEAGSYQIEPAVG